MENCSVRSGLINVDGRAARAPLLGERSRVVRRPGLTHTSSCLYFLRTLVYLVIYDSHISLPSSLPPSFPPFLLPSLPLSLPPSLHPLRDLRFDLRNLLMILQNSFSNLQNPISNLQNSFLFRISKVHSSMHGRTSEIYLRSSLPKKTLYKT